MTTLQSSSQEQLRRLVSQIEKLEDEKKGLAEDIRDKFAEAKATGFDVKALRQVLKLRKQSKTDRDEEQAVLETYLHALGMLSDQMGDTPMGDWARGEAGKAHANLKRMAREDGAKISVQFGDGPEIPL